MVSIYIKYTKTTPKVYKNYKSTILAGSQIRICYPDFSKEHVFDNPRHRVFREEESQDCSCNPATCSLARALSQSCLGTRPPSALVIPCRVGWRSVRSGRRERGGARGSERRREIERKTNKNRNRNRSIMASLKDAHLEIRG